MASQDIKDLIKLAFLCSWSSPLQLASTTALFLPPKPKQNAILKDPCTNGIGLIASLWALGSKVYGGTNIKILKKIIKRFGKNITADGTAQSKALDLIFALLLLQSKPEL